MPYANNQDIRIHYRVEGEGPPLVLQHGFSSTLQTWYDYGYVDALQQDYHLLLLDARGHGASDKPHEPEAYDLERRVGDIVAVLDQENIAQAHYLGYSMGGWIGYGVAKYAPERFQSLIIGGSIPYARSTEGQRQILRTGIEEGLDAFMSDMEKTFGPLEPKLKAQILANDLKALLALTQDRPSLESVLPTMQMPCLLYVGEADSFCSGLEACAQHIPNVTFVSLPGLDHIQGMERSDLVLPHVTTFLNTVSHGVQTAGS